MKKKIISVVTACLLVASCTALHHVNKFNNIIECDDSCVENGYSFLAYDHTGKSYVIDSDKRINLQNDILIELKTKKGLKAFSLKHCKIFNTKLIDKSMFMQFI